MVLLSPMLFRSRSLSVRLPAVCLNQEVQANLPGATLEISFTPLAVLWNQALMLP